MPGPGRHEVGEHVGPQDLAFVPVQPPAQRFALYTSRLHEQATGIKVSGLRAG